MKLNPVPVTQVENIALEPSSVSYGLLIILFFPSLSETSTMSYVISQDFSIHNSFQN